MWFCGSWPMKTSHLWAIESRFLWWAVLPAETVPSGYLWDDLTAFQRFSAVMVGGPWYVGAAWVTHPVQCPHNFSHAVICQNTRDSWPVAIKTVVNFKPRQCSALVCQTMMTQCPVRAVMTEIYTLLLELGPCWAALWDPLLSLRGGETEVCGG